MHMNATRWHSLSEFIKFLGRDGVVRVEEGERGLEVAWVDNSPDALRRAEAVRKRERMERGDEEREQRLIRDQIERAQRDAEDRGDENEDGLDEEVGLLQREGGKKITLNFGVKVVVTVPAAEVVDGIPGPIDEEVLIHTQVDDVKMVSPSEPEAKISLSLGASKPKNVFAASSKKNALAGSKSFKPALQRPVSEAERIMKEELERKRKREAMGFKNSAFKKQKT